MHSDSKSPRYPSVVTSQSQVTDLERMARHHDRIHGTQGFWRDNRTSAGRVVSHRELRAREIYGHATVEQHIRAGAAPWGR